MKSFDDHPFQLAAGANTGADDPYGCLMNVVSWMNGDTQITDYPSCTNKVLGSLCITFNDEALMKFGVPGRRIGGVGEFQVFANVATPDQAMRMTQVASLVMDTSAVADADARAWRERVTSGLVGSWFVGRLVQNSDTFDEAFDQFMAVVNDFRSTFAVELGLKDDAHV